MVKLAGWQGDDVLERPLGAPTTVGRDADCAFHVPSHEVSRHHCRIEPMPGGRHRLVDLGSKNGTYLNGRRVSTVELRDYDVVRVGEVELVCLPDHADAREALAARASRPLPEPAGADLGLLSRQTDEDIRRSVLRERLFQLALASKDVVSDLDVRHLLRALLREAMTFASADWGAVYLTDEGPAASMELEVALPTSAPGAPPEVLRVLFDTALRGRRACLRGFCAPPQPGHGEPAAGSALCVPLDTFTGLGGWRSDAGDAPAREGGAPGDGSVTEPARSGGPLSGPDPAGGPASATGALVLVAARGLDALTDEDRRMLEAIAGQAAAVVQRAWLYRQATVDPVTQLTNRAWTERVLAEELRRMRVRRGPLSVVVMDLDHFKRINDTYGHPVGDAVLRAVARRVRSALREGDLVGRWGGDELLVALAGVSSEGARTAAEKVARAIQDPPIVLGARRISSRVPIAPLELDALGGGAGPAPAVGADAAGEGAGSERAPSGPREARASGRVVAPGNGTLRVTLSLGIATYPEHGTTAELLVRHADRALYEAKSRGRAQAVVYSADLDGTSQHPTDLVIDFAEGSARFRPESTLSLQCGALPLIQLPEQAVVTIGRSPSCDVVLDDPDVSPLHATITGTGSTRLVEDRASLGGTHLNGRRLSAPAPLEPGDVITIGPHDLRLVAEDRPRASDAADDLAPPAAGAGVARALTSAERDAADEQEELRELRQLARRSEQDDLRKLRELPEDRAGAQRAGAGPEERPEHDRTTDPRDGRGQPERREPRPRLLLVEDNPDLRAAIETLLEDFEVTPVRTVAEALLALRPGFTSLAGVLAADHLPDGEGSAVLDAVQELSPGSARVLLAAHADDPSVEAVAEAHRHLVLGKPVDPADLLLARRLLSVVGTGLRRADPRGDEPTRGSPGGQRPRSRMSSGRHSASAAGARPSTPPVEEQDPPHERGASDPGSDGPADPARDGARDGQEPAAGPAPNAEDQESAGETP